MADQQWFIQAPGPIGPAEAEAIRRHWRQNGLGEVMILADGMTVAEVVDGNLSTLPHAVTMTSEQFAEFMDTIRPAGVTIQEGPPAR